MILVAWNAAPVDRKGVESTLSLWEKVHTPKSTTGPAAAPGLAGATRRFGTLLEGLKGQNAQNKIVRAWDDLCFLLLATVATS